MHMLSVYKDTITECKSLLIENFSMTFQVLLHGKLSNSQTFKIYSWERESGIDEPQGIKRNYLFVFLHLEWCAAIERDRISDHEGRYEARDLEIK